MKLYTFLDQDGNIIEQVRAESHDQAIKLAGVSYETDFYSESIQLPRHLYISKPLYRNAGPKQTKGELMKHYLTASSVLGVTVFEYNINETWVDVVEKAREEYRISNRAWDIEKYDICVQPVNFDLIKVL